MKKNKIDSKTNLNKKKENKIDLPIIGRSTLIQKTYKTIAKIVGTNLTVMILGESGTGKELIARILHDYGLKKNGPFVGINIASIPEDLIESELFGHEKGSFTGANSRKSGKIEEANNGTLFLDEIGDMSYDTQTKLLRVLEEEEFTTIGGNEKIKSNVRIITSTHRNLKDLIRNGKFREDLYNCLNVLPIHLPPLRSRLDDIEDLANHFLNKCVKEGLQKKEISNNAVEALKKYKWPGNIRELENFIRRMVVLVATNKIHEYDVEKNLKIIYSSNSTDKKYSENSLSMSVETHLKKFFSIHGRSLPSSGLYTRVLSEVERPLISLCLNKTNGNQIKAAQLLGLNRNTLRKKIKELRIDFLKTKR